MCPHSGTRVCAGHAAIGAAGHRSNHPVGGHVRPEPPTTLGRAVHQVHAHLVRLLAAPRPPLHALTALLTCLFCWATGRNASYMCCTCGGSGRKATPKRVPQSGAFTTVYAQTISSPPASHAHLGGGFHHGQQMRRNNLVRGPRAGAQCVDRLCASTRLQVAESCCCLHIFVQPTRACV